MSAELRKLAGLPGAWAGLLIGLLAGPLLVVLNAPAVRRALADGTVTDRADLGLQHLGLALIGATVLGVVTISSEYTRARDDTGSRQVSATLLATPRRVRLLGVKTAALVLVVAGQGVLATILTLAVTAVVHGTAVPAPGWGRCAGAVLFWVLTALLAYAFTIVTRSGIVPLVLFLVNSSVVSVSYLLTKLTPAAAYLPDIVGAHMFLHGMDSPVHPPPLVAGLIMTAWVAVLLAAAGTLFVRRDA
ncbi:hypothetical protein [Symbioplanes lichenis]|uniref:hypothetical protein n=1 Tax=Symbioplanes lichenis TaxID=1629072 RepID=UPI002739FD7C|nr:hypothetical protein [Actinoplanes lichenis]